MKSNPSRLALLLIAACFCATGFVRLAAAPPVPLKSEILAAYVTTANAFASDDFTAVKSAATALADKADIADQQTIMKQAAAVATAADISAARDAFKPLSASIEPLAVGEKGYTIMTCSMANADWVQVSGEVKNPYLGKSMQSCGEPKKIANEPAHDSDDSAGGHDGKAQHGCG